MRRRQFSIFNFQFSPIVSGSRMKTIIGRNFRGFTLVELLVVISIIGILTALGTANFIDVRKKARDGQRKADLRQIQTANELYRSDTGGYAATLGTCGGALSANGVTYMQRIPCDPSNRTTSYIYTPNCPSGSKCTSYTLYGCAENVNDAEAVAQSGCASGKKFEYTNP